MFCKKAVSEILQNSQENTCARASFLIKLQLCQGLFLIKLQACIFIKFLNPFLTEHLWWLLFIIEQRFTKKYALKINDKRFISNCILDWMCQSFNAESSSEAVFQRCSVKKIFLEISLNS